MDVREAMSLSCGKGATLLMDDAHGLRDPGDGKLFDASVGPVRAVSQVWLEGRG